MAKKEYGTRKKYHFVYKTTNLVNQKYYFGMHSTDNLEDGYLGSGTYLRRSITKYGKENFRIEILESCSSREELAEKEKKIITLQEITKKECMNLKPGGQGGFTEEEWKKGQEISSNVMKEKWKCPKFQEQMAKVLIERNKKLHGSGKVRYDNFKGRKHTPETIELMKKAKQETGKGCNNSQYGTCWITNEVENRKIHKGDVITEGWRLGRKLK